MPMPDDILDYLVANIATWVNPVTDPANGNIFIEQRPSVPDRAASIHQIPGNKPARTLGGLFAWEEPKLRVINRATTLDWSTAESDAQAIWDLLKAIKQTTINGIVYMLVDPVGNPAPSLLDPNNRPLYVSEFAVMKYVSD